MTKTAPAPTVLIALSGLSALRTELAQNITPLKSLAARSMVRIQATMLSLTASSVAVCSPDIVQLSGR